MTSARSRDLASRISQAKKTNSLYLSFCNLREIPPEVFELKNLVKLDLGCNLISTLPSTIGEFKRLEYLWLNNNPLEHLPKEIEECKKLKQLDLRKTKIYELPRELGRLKQLVDVDLKDIPLKESLRKAYDEDNEENTKTTSLLNKLKKKDEKNLLKSMLEAKLLEGIYREIADNVGVADQVKQLVKRVFKVFTDSEEQRSMIRNCDRLFPERLEKADANKIYKVFISLRRENQKKKLRAELELKLRAIYFDAIRPEKVEGILNDIYLVIGSSKKGLEDIQFLLKHMNKLFPKNASDVDCETINVNMNKLRDFLANERSEALEKVRKQIRNMYSDVDPENCHSLLNGIGQVFKRTEDLRKLASDALSYFPPEFELAKPRRIRKAFLAQKRENMI